MANKKIALVTGGNRGIGRAIARQLSDQGIHVIITARKISDGQSVVDEIIEAGGSSEVMLLEMTDSQQRERLVRDIDAQYQRLDILVNNAGVALDKWVPGADLDIQVMRDTMEVNVYASLQLIQLALPLMKRNQYGRIVNLSSELASLNDMHLGMTLAYRTSKAALNAITRILALELEEYPDIKINAAAPGWVKTELGGDDAPLTPEQGAITPVWLATLPEDGPSGGFYREKQAYPW
ncbi:SDR family oxidoreductase [Thalassotalea mangrovi]|uniref:SDR family oxidoreductase n=1 Tax=Thalassotalea mangrovi TaxID=2572245 RepID=A0A4U1B6I8_9GAMM|nr:SDR family oxidoreductase [Thalassotalea mangrovi]TKB46060.1 SDR family oxidoreductase [Thalassotalea mangrovi]